MKKLLILIILAAAFAASAQSSFRCNDVTPSAGSKTDIYLSVSTVHFDLKNNVFSATFDVYKRQVDLKEKKNGSPLSMVVLDAAKYFGATANAPHVSRALSDLVWSAAKESKFIPDHVGAPIEGTRLKFAVMKSLNDLSCTAFN